MRTWDKYYTICMGNDDLKDLPSKYVLSIFLTHFYFFLPADDLQYTVNTYCLKGFASFLLLKKH